MRPYFMDEKQSICIPSVRDVDAYYAGVHELPNYLEYLARDFMYKERHYIKNMGFTLLTQEFLDKLSKFLKDKKVLEVMCGTGFLASQLRLRGVDIIATDDMTGKYDFKVRHIDDIKIIDCVDAIDECHEDIDYVIMGWPEMSNDAARVLKSCYKYNIPLIYMGEFTRNGCTADAEFYDFATKHFDEYWKIGEKYRTFLGLHDSCILLKKKGKLKDV